MAWTAIYVHKVDDGTEITVTMSFANLESNSAASDTDYIFRADVRNADCCEGGGMGNDRYMYQVDEDPEVRTGSISVSCAPGGYTVEVSISSPGNVKPASAADFTVNAPEQQQPEPTFTDATLSGEPERGGLRRVRPGPPAGTPPRWTAA